MSAEYDAEFWFDAAGYTVLDWKVNFTSEARKAFDAWLNRVRAEAWDDGHRAGVTNATDPEWLDPIDNPYREVNDE